MIADLRGWMRNQGFPSYVFDGRPVIGICIRIIRRIGAQPTFHSGRASAAIVATRKGIDDKRQQKPLTNCPVMTIFRKAGVKA